MDTKELKNDRTEWFKNNSYTEEERNKLIKDKIQKVYDQREFDLKVRAIFHID